MKQWWVLAGFVGLCFAVAAIGGFATMQAVTEWYPTLNKPNWTPPSWLFGPVWTVLYLMMAVAAWLVWKQGNSRAALILWGGQLLLNLAWSFLFFGARSPTLGLIDIAALWVSIVATIFLFAQKSRVAAYLMVPYLCWVSFATALNAAINLLN
jgi:tryptophan-rich sensory protein